MSAHAPCLRPCLPCTVRARARVPLLLCLRVQEAWEREVDELRERLVHSCCALSAARRAAVPRLVGLVQGALGELAMGHARFDVQVAWVIEPEVRLLLLPIMMMTALTVSMVIACGPQDPFQLLW